MSEALHNFSLFLSFYTLLCSSQYFHRSFLSHCDVCICFFYWLENYEIEKQCNSMFSLMIWVCFFSISQYMRRRYVSAQISSSLRWSSSHQIDSPIDWWLNAWLLKRKVIKCFCVITSVQFYNFTIYVIKSGHVVYAIVLFKCIPCEWIQAVRQLHYLWIEVVKKRHTSTCFVCLYFSNVSLSGKRYHMSPRS